MRHWRASRQPRMGPIDSQQFSLGCVSLTGGLIVMQPGYDSGADRLSQESTKCHYFRCLYPKQFMQ